MVMATGPTLSAVSGRDGGGVGEAGQLHRQGGTGKQDKWLVTVNLSVRCQRKAIAVVEHGHAASLGSAPHCWRH